MNRRFELPIKDPRLNFDEFEEVEWFHLKGLYFAPEELCKKNISVKLLTYYKINVKMAYTLSVFNKEVL